MKVTDFSPKGQDDVKLPNGTEGQDVILAWESGPLPTAELEHIAWLLFRFRYPQVDFANRLCSAERNECRRLALQLRARFLKMDRWTLATAAEKLTDESCQLLFGDRALHTNTRNQVKDYAESYLEDLAKLFSADLRAGSESWQHSPEDEPDDSEIEVIPEKVN